MSIVNFPEEKRGLNIALGYSKRMPATYAGQKVAKGEYDVVDYIDEGFLVINEEVYREMFFVWQDSSEEVKRKARKRAKEVSG